eukprot:m.411074 g.411074  ORF g.411074 m.411074 type:complete len:96 (-) comp28559_c0_seq1:100-387(-)
MASANGTSLSGSVGSGYEADDEAEDFIKVSLNASKSTKNCETLLKRQLDLLRAHHTVGYYDVGADGEDLNDFGKYAAKLSKQQLADILKEYTVVE